MFELGEVKNVLQHGGERRNGRLLPDRLFQVWLVQLILNLFLYKRRQLLVPRQFDQFEVVLQVRHLQQVEKFGFQGLLDCLVRLGVLRDKGRNCDEESVGAAVIAPLPQLVSHVRLTGNVHAGIVQRTHMYQHFHA